MIELHEEICSQYSESSSREWLETNGIGGYASSTVSGANSRRYHGLLVAATRPPIGRVVMLSKFEETLVIDGERFELSSNRYPGRIYPEGYRFVTGFKLDPFPQWTIEVNGTVLERSVFMVNGENTTVCRWRIVKAKSKKAKISLELRPLIAFRDHHHLRHDAVGWNGEYDAETGYVSIRPVDDLPAMHLAHNASEVEDQGFWYRDLEYAIEKERGFDYTEDLYQPFCMKFDLATPAAVVASTDPKAIVEADNLEKAELKRRAMIVAAARTKDPTLRTLALAADQFIVDRGDGKTVIAGYPWFSDWGRDTMIALNGLTLATNRPEIARSIIAEFALYLSEGMLPNRFPDEGEDPDYNTVDATLWYFEAIRAYAEKTGDYLFVHSELYDKLVNVIEWHVRGTRFGIGVDSDGLLRAGEPGVQLTWMDAKIGDWVVTPRTGKAVEIQALWFNALRIMSGLAELFGDDENQHRFFEMSEIAQDSFNGQFWNQEENCLFDVIIGDERDASVRPNQIFAVSLPHSMLDADRSRAVVGKVEAELLTPFGLRSLSPNDPRYVPAYLGSPLDRDASYHQGTVWGWLIGPFVDAYRKVHSQDAKAKKRINEILSSFDAHLSEAMLGQVSEIFDGDPPHAPRGAPAQAWSVAALLRVSR